jgi:alpha-mannosidase
VDSDPEFRRRNPQTVLGLFGQGWDAVKTIVPLEDPDHSFPAVAQRLSNPQRRIIVSNERDYFEDLQAAYGADLPEVSLAFGNEWELYSASLAEVSASVRRATEKLRAAEAMAALVSQQRGEFADDLRPLRDQAWIAFGLYWEHDWTANGPISRERRAAWQRKIARQISDYVDALHERASAALGELLPAAPGVRRILVFNPLCWPRTDHVLIPWDGDEQQATTAFDVAAGQAVPTQWVVRDGKRLLQFLATQVPACGYRLFELRAEAAADPAPRTIEFQDSGLRSARHRLEIGASGSIVAWESLELVRTIVAKGQRANEFEGGIGKVSLESQGPVSTTVRIDVPRPTARTTRIMLLESLDRIEIENTILENFSEVESWRYEFELDAPRTFHEEVGAILQAAVKSQGGDYADRNARTDWLTLNHFVTMHDGATAVTLSNRDCLFFHLGERIKDPMDSASNVIHVLAGGQVDGPELGIPRQGGDRVFTQRFALQCRGGSSTTDRAASMRFALEHSNPLVAAEVTGPGELDPAPRAGLECDSEHVVVWALKPSEDGAGQGTIVRLWNLAEQPFQYTLKMNPPIGKCIQTTHIETDLEPMEVIAGAVTETLASGAIRTLRILPA